MNIRTTFNTTLAVAAVLGLTACAGNMAHKTADMKMPMASDQSKLPDAMKVPAGHRVAMETVGKGLITYECRAKKDMAGQHAWDFVGPDA